MDLLPNIAADPVLRIYAIIRGDLKMPAGKAAAQAGHAFLESYLSCEALDSVRCVEYMSAGHGTKVVLVAPSLYALEDAEDLARELKLPHALITDEGHILPPHFDGSPIVTALGIGPVLRREAHAVTSRFQTL